MLRFIFGSQPSEDLAVPTPEVSSVVPTRSEDDIRALRIARLEALAKGAEAMNSTQIQSSSASEPNLTSTQIVDAPISAMESSVPKATLLSAVTVELQQPASPVQLQKPVLISTSSPGPAMQDMSPNKTFDITARTINLALEFAFQLTLRQANETAVVKYVEMGMANELLNSLNIGPAICCKLSDDDSSAIVYLIASYKRLAAKEVACNEACKAEIVECKLQVASFVASLLTNSDMFGTVPTREPVLDLYSMISEDISQAMSSFLKFLIDELCRQDSLATVLSSLVAQCVSNLKSPGSSGVRSVLDNHTTSLACLSALTKADKRVCALLVTCPEFRLSLELATAKPANLPQYMLHNPNTVEQRAVQGAAVEHNTLFGLILRCNPDVHDPQMHSLFGATYRSTRSAVEANIASVRQSLIAHQSACGDCILNMLKAGGVSKDGSLGWLTDAIALNAECEKGHPSPLVGASAGFTCNLGAVMLQICRPVISESVGVLSASSSPVKSTSLKICKVDWEYLLSPESLQIFPRDSTRLMTLDVNDSSMNGLSNLLSQQSTNFITQSYFMCWRALHVGVVQQFNSYEQILRGLSHFHAGLATGEQRAVHYLVAKMTADSMLLSGGLLTDVMSFCSSAATSLMLILNDESTAAVTSSTSDWLLSMDSLSEKQKRILLAMPEHLLDDILSMLLFVAKNDPSHLGAQPLDSVLTMIVYFLRRPWAMKSPHMRAKLGLILFHVFLPGHLRSRDDSHTQQPVSDGPHSFILSSHLDSQKYLAPALLLLYGEVEKTGYYEKLTNRRCIMIVLKHLWSLPTHRAAFRGIVNSCENDLGGSSLSPSASLSSSPSPTSTIQTSSMQGDSSGGADEGTMILNSNNVNLKNYFIKFANGLLNETNALVAMTMDKLVEIRKTQLQMQDTTEWGQLPEDERERLRERHEANERECRGSAVLCLETMHMLNYLTSDEVIQLPFLMDEILPRFTSTLMSIATKLVGNKSLEIKVDNMESYQFRPKDMLRESCAAMCHFSKFPSFWTAVAHDGFYGNGDQLIKALDTVRRHQLLGGGELAALEHLVQQVGVIHESEHNIEDLAQSAPEEFLDPLLLTLMKDPVRLPTSNNFIDRATIAQHLLNTELDPFNRQPLTIDMVEPAVELKQRINDWIAMKLAEKLN